MSNSQSAETFSRPLANLRDLGGIAVADGYLRYQKVWRSDDPTLSPHAEISSLAEQGLHTVLDLRSAHEVSASPHEQAFQLGIRPHHLPLAQGAVDPLSLLKLADSMRSPADVGHWYATLIREHTAEVAQGLKVMEQTEGGVLFHCAAGKDRTGIMAAVLLTLLGAERSVIVEDYAHTRQNLTAIFSRLSHATYASSPRSTPEETERASSFFMSNHPLLGAAEESMDEMLTAVGGRSGLLGLLSDHLQTEDVVDSLHEKLVSSSSK